MGCLPSQCFTSVRDDDDDADDDDGGGGDGGDGDGDDDDELLNGVCCRIVCCRCPHAESALAGAQARVQAAATGGDD